MKIYQKLFNVQNEIEHLIKSETNKFQHYQYFNEYQILTKIKPLLEKYKLLVLISDEKEVLEYSKQEKEYLVKYLKNVKVINVEEGKDDLNEELNFNFWAAGSNNDLAKAKGAAETYAMKYFLSKFFLIPVTDQNDPDTR